jgi:hypothetical protein
MALASVFFGWKALAEPQLNSSGLINIIRSKAGVISLNGPSCQELADQDQALRAWTVNSRETPGPQASAIETPEQKQCKLVIDDSVPSFVHSLQDFKTAFSGPNCWNTVLRLSQLAEFSRYSSPEEMTFWMNSPYCRELTEAERTLPGDIVAIRDRKHDQAQAFDEIHGMIYLSENLAFSKNTSSRMSAYGIQRASLVYQTFRLMDSKCMKVKGQPADCFIWANHYRCAGSKSDRHSLEKENPAFAILSAEVRKIESVFSEYVMDGHGDYEKNNELIKKHLVDIENRILSTPKDSEGTGFFLKAFLQEIKSLKAQAGIISKQPRPL